MVGNNEVMKTQTEDQMSKAHIRFSALFLSFMVSLMCLTESRKAFSDTGHEGATRIERGSYPEMRVVSLSSVTGTNIFPTSTKRPDSICKNYGSTIIFIGTNTATTHGSTHANIVSGFPIESSATFKLDGSFTGYFSATCDQGVSSCQMRCLDGLVR